MISLVEQGRVPEKKETRGKTREVLVARSMFNPEVFKMKDGVLMFTKAANRNRIGEVWRIYPLESMFMSSEQSGWTKGFGRNID